MLIPLLLLQQLLMLSKERCVYIKNRQLNSELECFSAVFILKHFATLTLTALQVQMLTCQSSTSIYM